ncbi:MAG: thiamine phosphate synthase [Bacteroidota bacterium]
MLRFSRIAILDPNLIMKEWVEEDARDDVVLVRAATQDWLNKIREHEADALYFRSQNFPLHLSAEISTLLQAIQFPIIHRSDSPESILTQNFIALQYRPHETPPHPRNFLAGASCHSLEDVLQAEKSGFDYVFLSPVFSTQTHPEATPLGLEAFRNICLQTQLPVIALGGIDETRAHKCMEVGAAGIAGIRMFLR